MKMKKLLSMPMGRAGVLLMCIGAPVCVYFSRATLPYETLDRLLPVAGCAVCLWGAALVSKCIAAIRSEE